jgi:pyruvate formate lyase activating enzyme
LRFALVRTTLLDYPGKVAASVFLPGCHLRCPYCHNPDLVELNQHRIGNSLNEDSDGFRDFLSRRAELLGGVVFSGGEALLHPLLPELIGLVKDAGLPVKLDTAGLLPDALATYLDNGCLNYVAMDLKTLPDRYSELGWKGSGESSADKLLKRTMSLLAESGIPYEIRTTVVPPLVDETVLRNLAELTTGVPRWVWQPYQQGNTLNPAWSSLKTPNEDELRILAKEIGRIPEIIIP